MKGDKIEQLNLLKERKSNEGPKDSTPQDRELKRNTKKEEQNKNRTNGNKKIALHSPLFL